MTDTAQQKLDKIKQKLTEIASLEAWSDDEDFDVDGNSGGQTDDAYYGGQNDGEIQLARDLLTMFFDQ